MAKEINVEKLSKFIERSMEANHGGMEKDEYHEQDKEICSIVSGLNSTSKDVETILNNLAKILGREVKSICKINKNSVLKIGDGTFHVVNIIGPDRVEIRGIYDKCNISITPSAFTVIIADDNDVVKYWTTRFMEMGDKYDEIEDSFCGG